MSNATIRNSKGFLHNRIWAEQLSFINTWNIEIVLKTMLYFAEFITYNVCFDDI